MGMRSAVRCAKLVSKVCEQSVSAWLLLPPVGQLLPWLLLLLLLLLLPCLLLLPSSRLPEFGGPCVSS